MPLISISRWMKPRHSPLSLDFQNIGHNGHHLSRKGSYIYWGNVNTFITIKAVSNTLLDIILTIYRDDPFKLRKEK